MIKKTQSKIEKKKASVKKKVVAPKAKAKAKAKVKAKVKVEVKAKVKTKAKATLETPVPPTAAGQIIKPQQPVLEKGPAEKPQEKIVIKEQPPVAPPIKPPPPPIIEEKITKKIKIGMPVTLKDLAIKLRTSASEIIKFLMKSGILITINQSINEDLARQVAEFFGYEIELLPTSEEQFVKVTAKKIETEKLTLRPPVVTLMGHVDHGKTSLLDAIRKSHVTEQEAGGITQHIGAYEVVLDKGKVTFLDTPGHEAFTAMRARGASATDIVVLVVAADDGVMPQTEEAIDHAKAAGVPLVVAINKIDKPNIDIQKVKKQLMNLGLKPEDWEGKTIMMGVSAKTGAGIDELLEMLLLEAEMLELKADANKFARGVVIEGKLSKGGGPVATILVQEGTLRQGDFVVTGPHYGRVRALFNDRIHRVKEAPPSMPVEILGLNGVPHAGDIFFVVEDEKKAKEFAEKNMQLLKERQAGLTGKITLVSLYEQIKEGRLKELKIILKADVGGSVEALKGLLNGLSASEIKINIIHVGVGDINDSDILLAAASNAIVIGFHVGKTPEAEVAAKDEGVDVRLYKIIYEVSSDIKAAMEGMLVPHLKEVSVGKAVVKQAFKVSKVGTIAGCQVIKGKITRNVSVRLLREGKIIYEGKISSLKRFKDDVKEAAEGFECGIGLSNFSDPRQGDIIDAYIVEEVARKLE